MQAVACPQCGAPIQGPVSGPIYQCPYCNHTSKSQAPVAPQFIIVQPPASSRSYSQAPPPQFHVSTPARSGMPVLPFLMPLLIVALVMGITFRGPLMNLTGLGAWDGSEPLVCGGNDDIEVSGVNAKFTSGAAVVVRSNCKVTLKNCTIQSPVAINASGNATVTIVNGTINGEIDAAENAHVDLVGNAKQTGPIKKLGINAKVNGR